VVKDYEIYDNHVVVILYDTTRVTIRPAQLSGGSLAYHKLLFLFSIVLKSFLFYTYSREIKLPFFHVGIRNRYIRKEIE
jgi:hypothetical protein